MEPKEAGLPPTVVSMFIYFLASIVASTEYFSTISNHEQQLQIASHQVPNFRQNELDDSLSRARNITGGTRALKRDASPLEVPSETNAVHITPKSSGEENRTMVCRQISHSLHCLTSILSSKVDIFSFDC